MTHTLYALFIFLYYWVSYYKFILPKTNWLPSSPSYQ